MHDFENMWWKICTILKNVIEIMLYRLFNVSIHMHDFENTWWKICTILKNLIEIL